MKNLFKTFAAGLIMAASLSSFAIANPNPFRNMAPQSIVNEYVDATAKGETADVEHLFSSDFSMKVNAQRSSSYNRSEVLSFIKRHKGIVQDCAVSNQIIEENSNYILAKITYTYTDFVKYEYVELNREEDAWKVSKVTASYK